MKSIKLKGYIKVIFGTNGDQNKWFAKYDDGDIASHGEWGDTIEEAFSKLWQSKKPVNFISE